MNRRTFAKLAAAVASLSAAPHLIASLPEIEFPEKLSPCYARGQQKDSQKEYPHPHGLAEAPARSGTNNYRSVKSDSISRMNT